MGLFSVAKLFGMTIRESATDGSDFTNPDADYRRLFLGEDGALHLKDSAGTVTDIGGAGGSVATDAIFDAKGDLPVGTGANTAAKLTVGTNGFALIAASGESTGLKWGVLPGTLLAVTQYAPASQTILSTSSTTMVDADATNLTVTFTAPASGNVLVRLGAYADNSSGTDGFWGLRESSTTLSGSIGRVTRVGAVGTYILYTVYLTGVSAGSHTYKWAFGAESSTTRIIVRTGSTEPSATQAWSPAIMEVWAA